jgi:DNA-binding response OmpR family regulator
MKILIAEDEADIRSLLKISLENEGYTVFSVNDGIDALACLKNEDIDLAILDVMMPRLDGFNLLRKIRETSTIPVIFLTARTAEMDKVLGLSIGADDYLAKPFSVGELIARVGAQLRRNNDYLGTKPKETNLIQYGDLTLDKDCCCLYKKDNHIVLNAKEYKLMQFLMENPEKVYTKKQLYIAVWEDDYYYDDNTIMVHISHLRSKIEDDPQNPEYLKTIRGIGYKFHKVGE